MSGRSEDVLAGLSFPVPTGPLPFLVPAQDLDTDFYWRGERDGVLRMLTCSACGYISHPPTPLCGRCHSADVAPKAVSGRGTLYAWSINVQPFVPGLDPYCNALVQLDEQADVRLTTQLVDVTTEQITAGMPVEVVFVTGAGDVNVPFFKPVRA